VAARWLGGGIPKMLIARDVQFQWRIMSQACELVSLSASNPGRLEAM
jgi:hypothetical protein